MKIFVEEIVEKSKESIPVEEGDYHIEGLLYCGKCKTPKQGTYKTPFGYVHPYILCKCAAEKKKREEQERTAREFRDMVKQFRRSGFPDRDMERMTFEANDGDGDQKVINIAKRYVDKFQEMRGRGKGLVLMGDTGTGKTYAAACIVNALIDQGYPCMITSLSREINTVQGMYDGKQDHIDSLNKYSLLVLDDVGVEGATPFRMEMIYNIIDTRYRSGLPLIVTTNIPWQELSRADVELPKKRIYSRILEMCIPIKVAGTDRRRASVKDDLGFYKDLLGL